MPHPGQLSRAQFIGLASSVIARLTLVSRGNRHASDIRHLRLGTGSTVSLTVFARSEIPRLRFGTGSAISAEGDEIAAHLSGARNDGLINQATTRIRPIRTSSKTGGSA